MGYEWYLFIFGHPRSVPEPNTGMSVERLFENARGEQAGWGCGGKPERKEAGTVVERVLQALKQHPEEDPVSSGPGAFRSHVEAWKELVAGGPHISSLLNAA